MKVEGPGTARPGQVRKAGKSGGDGAFLRHVQEGEGQDPASRPAGAGAAVGLNPLFALQEVEDALTGRRKAAKVRAETILDRLEELRLGLLSGRFPLERLHELSRMVQSSRDQVDDPRLQELLDEIDLRAQVEIAKLTPR
jgi:Class II flagellar assembly regulator